MPVIISETERSAEAARDRFRKVTQALLIRRQNSVLAGHINSGVAREQFNKEFDQAADEYLRNPAAKPLLKPDPSGADI